MCKLKGRVITQTIENNNNRQMEKEEHWWEKYVFQVHTQNIKINEYFDRRNKTNNFLIWLTIILL